MDTQERNARAVLQGIAEGIVDADLLAPEFRFQSALVDDLDGPTFVASVQQTGTVCRTPMTMEVHDVIAAPGRMAIVAESHADLISGAHYNNLYNWHFRFDEAGRITRLREFCDTHLAREVLWPAFAMQGGLRLD